MASPADVTAVAHVIQEAVAPVFLLTGIGAILAVMSTRLGRVIDRFRVLEQLHGHERAGHAREISTLHARQRWIHWAITLCTLCALLVCVVIAVLFVGAQTGEELSATIAGLFIAAMLALIMGLLCFLREIALATGVIHIARD